MFLLDKERVEIWQSAALPKLELMRASYVNQRFSRHAHERFALGVIEAGALGFYYRGVNVVAPAGAVNLANPDEPHTGHAAVETGWTYRMFYFDTVHLREAARQMSARPCSVPRFPTGVIDDSDLAGRIRAFHRELERGCSSRLEAETRFMEILGVLIRRHADVRHKESAIKRDHRAVRRIRDYIHAHYEDDISLDTLAEISALSPYYFTHLFTGEVGLSPHAYLTQVRVRRAKALLRAEEPPALVAQSVGFYDQSHLSRHFKRLTGLTPAKYRKIVQEIR